VPKSLLTVISIDLKDVPFEKALSVLAKKGNFKLSYNRSRIPVDKKVSVKMENVQALKVLIHLMKKTGTKLVITRKGQLAIVPDKKGQKQPTSMRKGNIQGQVFDGETREALPGANIYVFGKRMGTSSGSDGRFTIEDIPAGIHSLQFSYVGYVSRIFENIHVTESQVSDVMVSLTPETFMLKDVTVTPGQFSIMGKGPSVRQALTREDLEAVPFGEDVYRAISRLPGISSSDFSAKFSVRGGENEQVLVLMDGLELYEPFHLKDIDGGALSIIDVAAVEGIDLLTGGFSAEYGDRMSGVFNVRSIRPGKKRTSLGISFMNARIMSEGTFNKERGTWLVSARRGYLDLVMDLVGEKDPPRPIYYDVLSKVEYRLNAKQIFSANFLHARDRFNYVEDDQDEDNTGYGNTYGWLTLKSIPNSRLFIKSVASYGRLTHYRNGTGYTDNLTEINLMVRDKRDVDIFGFRQDWNLDLSNRWYLKWESWFTICRPTIRSAFWVCWLKII